MPKLEGVNWDDIASSEVVPEGRHPARVDKVEVRTSEQGNQYWGITFVLTQEPLTGRVVWAPFMLEPQNLWKLRQLCDAIGIDLAGRRDFDSDELIDQEVGVIVTHEDYQGQTRARVKGFYALT